MVVVRMFLIFLAIGPLAAAADDWSSDVALVKDMVVLDKAYIPALMIVKKGDLSRSQDAVDRLGESWDAFEAKWTGTVNQEWRSGFARIDELVGEATTLAGTAPDLARAYGALDEIRHIFARLREDVGIGYFADFVSSAERALGDVVRVVAEDPRTPMTSDELDAVEQQLLVAQQRWNVVAQTRFDKIVYRIDIYWMGDLSSTRAEGVFLLAELTRDVRTLDRAVLAEKLDHLANTVEHFLEILGSTPGE